MPGLAARILGRLTRGLPARRGRAEDLPELDLGATWEVPVTGPVPRPECRAFLKQDHVTYVQPVVEWAPRDAIRLYPEAAGRYALRIQRRDPDGSTGWTEAAVRVVGAPAGLMPSLVDLDRQTRLWTPTRREAQLIAHYEPETADLIRARVGSGSVVYDIGANIGFYSVLLARLVGPRGHVYCVEANPVCVYFLGANLAINGVDNAEVLPILLLDAERVCEFVINPANSLVGVAGDSPYAVKPGQKVLLPGLALDELIDRFELRPPDFLKIDIEGAEITAIRGMRGTLERDRPLLLIELHGRVVARKTLAHIADLGYHYREASSGREFPDAAALADWFPDACLQVLAEPR